MIKKFIPLLFILAIIITGCSVDFSGVEKVYSKEFIVGGERVIVGGEKLLGADELSNFIPEVKLEKWGNETYIRVWSDEEGDATAKQVGDKVVWENKDKSKEYNFYTINYIFSY